MSSLPVRSSVTLVSHAQVAHDDAYWPPLSGKPRTKSRLVYCEESNGLVKDPGSEPWSDFLTRLINPPFTMEGARFQKKGQWSEKPAARFQARHDYD